MAYNKKYAKLGESVIDYVNNREDAIEDALSVISGGISFYDQFYAEDSESSVVKFGKFVLVNIRFRRPNGLEPGHSAVGRLNSGFRPKDFFVTGVAVTQGFYPEAAFNITQNGEITVYNRRSTNVTYIHVTVVFESN